MSLTRILPSSFAFSIAVSSALVATAAHADPKAECIAANTRAQNLRHADKLVEARTQLLICARDVCPGPIKADCTNWLADVNNSMPTIVLGAKDSNGNDLVQVEVTMDGRSLSHAIDGQALPVDPGAHSLRFDEKGQPAVTRQIVIRQGEKNREIDVTIGTAAKTATAPTATSPPAKSNSPESQAAAPSPVPSPAHDQPREASTGSTQRILGLVAGGVGLVGVGVGTIFALKSQSKWNDAKTACGTGCGPGSEAYSLNDQSKQAGTAAAISFVAGGVLLVTGVVLYITAPRNEEPAIGALIGPRSIAVVGTF